MVPTWVHINYIIPQLELILDYIVLNHWLLDSTCFNNAGDNFISHHLVWQKAGFSKHHCTTELMSWKKCVNIHGEEKTVKLAYMVELLSRNHCWGSKTMSKCSSGSRRIKTWQQNSLDGRIKVRNLWVKLEGLCAERGWWKSCKPLYYTYWKAWKRLFFFEWWILLIVKSGICTRWRANWIGMAIIEYCSILWSRRERSLWVKDLYTFKKGTESIQVNSTRGTLKAKKNSTSFNWCLGRRNQRIYIPLNSCKLNLMEKSEVNNPVHLWQILQENCGKLPPVFLLSLVERMLWSCEKVIAVNCLRRFFGCLFNLYLMWPRKTCI